MLPKHKYLLSYRYSEIIHDLTVEFCQTFLSYANTLKYLSDLPTKRTMDQMIQAARSGKQNIVEGVGQSATSKKGEIKLLGVACASFEELTSDYEDFLRQRRLAIWPKTDSKVARCKHYAYRLSHLSNLSDLGTLLEKPKLPLRPEVAANLLLTFCHIATYLLSKQIKKAEELFITEGGYTENLFKKRLQAKTKFPK